MKITVTNGTRACEMCRGTGNSPDGCCATCHGDGRLDNEIQIPRVPTPEAVERFGSWWWLDGTPTKIEDGKALFPCYDPNGVGHFGAELESLDQSAFQGPCLNYFQESP